MTGQGTSVLSNKRPISYFLYLSKILVARRLNDYATTTIYSRYFRQVSETITALRLRGRCVMTSEQSDNSVLSVLVLLNLSAEFDTVVHCILLRRLEGAIGIKDQVLKWFRSYLSDRFQSVHVHKHRSERERVSPGVPEGSVLVPLLFNTYMIPFGNIIRGVVVTLMTHRCICHLEPTKVVRLEACVSDIKAWMAQNLF